MTAASGPGSAVALLTATRGLRAFADGAIAVLLPAYLLGLGFGPAQVGLLATATLLGSAALTLAAGLIAHRVEARRLLMAACGLMLATGVAFSRLHDFWPLMLVGFLGTINPSGGDVTPFLPLEQAELAHASAPQQRTANFARYALTGALMAALGALALSGLEPARAAIGLSSAAAAQGVFLAYGAVGVIALLLYRRLPAVDPAVRVAPTPLGPSRRVVFSLAALFSLDSFGGGFLLQSMIALWLFHRFDLSLAAAGQFFFLSGLLGAASLLAAPPLARRFGLINTMVFTHVPANLCAIGAAFAPTLPIALGLLLVRAALQQMDVPARTSYVMAVVTPAERAAAASVTNVPRSLASALSPGLAGLLLAATPFAWPLVIGGSLKIAYDLLLLARFRKVTPPEEG